MRVRAFVSLDLDGELSEFERSIVDAHVDHCATCREFRASAAASTAALRSAPLEPVAYSFTVPRRASRLAPLSAAAAAAAAAAVFVVGFATAVSPPGSTGSRDPIIISRADAPADVTGAPAQRGGALQFGHRAL